MKHVNTFTWDGLFLVFNPSKEVIIKDFSMEDGERIFRKIYSEGEPNERKNRIMGISSDEKLSGEFAKLIIDHGYDELSASSDEDVRNSITRRLNQTSKNVSLHLRLPSFTKYTPNTICRCGDWFFIIETCQSEEVGIDYDKENVSSRGGKREGSGRKGGFEKILFCETEPLRVPKYEKETIKFMLKWLIDRQAEGNGIKVLLSSLIDLIEEYISSNTDKADYNRLQEDLKLLKEFKELLPSFSIKEEYESEKVRNERNRINEEMSKLCLKK